MWKTLNLSNQSQSGWKLMQDNLGNNIHLRTFNRHQVMPLQSNFFWLLQQGIVKTCAWTSEGYPIVLGYWGSEDVVGQPLSQAHAYQIKCLTTVQAVLVPMNQWDSITDSIHRHIQETEELLYIIRSDRMYQRLRKILVWLANKFGIEVEIGKLIDLRLTHQDLAETIGATRVTVTKLINQLEQEGVITRPERNSIILRSL
jgi:CRP-like cAMP-binding protein